MTDARWSLEVRDGVTVARAAGLDGVEGVVHAFSTRRAAGGDFDVGPGDADGEPWAARRALFVRAAGLAGRTALAPRQVHGDRVVAPQDFAGATPEADAVVAQREKAGVAPAVRTADCLPVLLASAGGAAVAAVHAGWRGTAAGVVVRAVERLAALGSAPGSLRAALGPAIGPCCYEVGNEVVDAVARATDLSSDAIGRPGPGGRPHLDLAAANRRQLLSAGLADAAIETSPWCTHCRADLFWSFRRDGEAAGRMMACIGWAP